jgi:hypothetical protein
VAPSFTWSIYTSPDNTDTSTWTLHATVVSAPFGIFEDRFEIVFPAIETQFIKVVTRPLSPAVPDASNFPNIFITELEAFTTLRVRPGETLRTENERLSYNLNLLGTVSDQTGVGYNLFYRFDESDPASQRRTSLTNGVYVNHIFNDALSGSARLFRDDRDETGEKRSVEHSYNTSLRAAYLEHLVHTLSYTGTRLDDRDGASYTNSVFLRNAARLYKGWDAFLDAGFSWDKDGSGNRARSTIARVGTNLLPHEKLNVNVNYLARWSDRSGGPGRFRQEGDAQAFFSPFRTLSLFGRVSVVDEEEETRSFQSYSLNWSPFPEGTLQFFFNYSEELRSVDDSRNRTYGPGLRWRIRRTTFLEVSYNQIRNDSDIERSEFNNLDALLRISF